MRPDRVIAVVFAVVLTAVACSGAAQQSSRERIVEQVLQQVNQHRALNGVPAVRLEKRLTGAAQAHAEDMVRRDYLDHRSPDGRGMQDRAVAAGYPWRLIAENVAAGLSSPVSTVNSWMTSPGHRDNLLGADYVDAGIGYAQAPAEGRRPRYGYYWVIMLGAPAR